MRLFQVKMIKKDTKPPVWRRGMLPEDITFSQLALILEEMLDCDKTDLFEFEFYHGKVRLSEWKEGREIPKDYYYDFESAPDTFVNELFETEEWFTFKVQYEENEALLYRVEIEKTLERPWGTKDGQKHAAAEPVIVKQVGSENDWSNLQAKNDVLAADYFLQYGDAEYKFFGELQAELAAGKRGITACSSAVSRTEHNRKSANTMFGEFVNNLLLPYQEEMVKRLKKKTGLDEAQLDALPKEKAEELYAQISEEIVDKIRTELPKRFLENLHGIKKDMASRKPRVKDMLQSYAKDDLVLLAKELKLRYTGLRKEELAQKLANEILTPSVMARRLITLGDRETAAFEAAMNRKCFFPTEQEWEDLEAICEMDYISVYEDDYIEVPEEVTTVYSRINCPEFQRSRREESWMLECLHMFAYIHVVAPVNVVWQMYRGRKGFRVSLAEFLSIFEKVPGDKNPCTILNEKMVLSEVLRDNLYLRIEKGQREVPFYIPAEEEIHDYVQNAYPSKDSGYQKLREFLTKELKREDEEADYLCMAVYKEFSMGGGSLSDIMDLVNEKEITFQSDRQFEQFANIIMNVNNRTRMFELRGHTPNEMINFRMPSPKRVRPTIVPMSSMAADMLSGSREDLKKMGLSVDDTAKKVYPNDPCPCGSGKKYKKCCGRQ